MEKNKEETPTGNAFLDHSEQVTHGQAAMLVYSSAIGNIVYTFTFVTSVTGRPFWAAVWLGVLANLPLALWMVYLSRKIREGNLFHLLKNGLGKTVCNFIIIVYILINIAVAICMLNMFTGVVRVYFLQTTPLLAIMIFLLLICALFAYSGIKTIGRWAQIMSVLFTVNYFLGFFLSFINLHEFNPMLGHRGCRLAVTYPEIAEMQTRAVIEAAIEVKQELGLNILPEIMIPLVGEEKELKFVKDIVDNTVKKVFAEKGVTLEYMVGTMIEVPRAAVTADDIAKQAEFFSFGTNDLTQMTFGFSRDDAGKFLDDYYQRKIYESDPFARLDQTGVGKLVKMAVELGKKTRPNIKLGICGEHGGEPSSVIFCHNIGLNYVSCSPFRVPIARLAAAHAVILSKQA